MKKFTESSKISVKFKFQLIDSSEMLPHLRNPSGSSGKSSERDSEIASSGIHSNDDGDSGEVNV